MVLKDSHHDNTMPSQDDSLISPKAKGERLKRIRHLANLTREELCAGSEINLTTLISWEVGRFGGLSAKGASRVIQRVASEGVYCSSEWLLYDIGAGPEVRADYRKTQYQPEIDNDIRISSDDSILIEELMLFRKLNKHAIDFIIEDDVMFPHYSIGDYVAGTKRFGVKISSLVSWDCIVQINDGRIVMRKLQLGPRNNSYNLISTNLQTKAKDAIIYDVELISAAPILWHRRKEPNF
jgi:transcriptional regulator with XRE-family HTH domain